LTWAPSGFRLRVQRIIGSRDRVSRKDRDLVQAWADARSTTCDLREINRCTCCLPKVIGVNPEEERYDWTRGVTDTLIDAVIRAYSGQRLAVVGWQKSIKRDRGRSNSMHGIVVSE
jgi:hypothetical protein